jgi:hypothetical protein
MNERTIDLYKQATEFAYNSIGKEHSNTAYFQGTIAGKFAELIVGECTKVVENLSPGYDDYRNQIEDAFRRDCVEQMKQHFGVEE